VGGRIQVGMGDQALGEPLHIVVNQRQHAESDQQYQGALGGFDQRDQCAAR